MRTIWPVSTIPVLTSLSVPDLLLKLVPLVLSKNRFQSLTRLLFSFGHLRLRGAMDLHKPLPCVGKNLVDLLFLLVGEVEALEHTLDAAASMQGSQVLSLSASRVSLAIKVDSQPTCHEAQKENRNYCESDPQLLIINRFHKDLPGQKPCRVPGRR